MSTYFGYHNVLVMLLAASMLASMVINSECRLLQAPEEEEEEDQKPLMKSVLELSSRDDMLQMAGYGEEKLSTVLITGTVLCNQACLAASHEHPPQPISGALVGATCQTNTIDKTTTWAIAVTDEYGEFIIDLPSHIHAIPGLDKACSVRILQRPKNSPCHRSTWKLSRVVCSSFFNSS